jgi:acetyl esterase/lipase
MAVYRAVLETTPSRNVGIFGTSAGGGLTLAMVLRAKQERLPLPGAIAPGTPWSDMTKTGDSYFSNEMVDNVLVSDDGFGHAAALLYPDSAEIR